MDTKRSLRQIVRDLDTVYRDASYGRGARYRSATRITYLVDEGEQKWKCKIYVCPTPLRKPTSRVESDHPPGEHGVADPFGPPFDPDLAVGKLQHKAIDADHIFLLQLSPFTFVANHFVMVPRNYESQTAPLTPGDLTHAYMTLVTARDYGEPLLAFYDCGDNSGASQPGKRLQFVTMPSEDQGVPLAYMESFDKPEDISKPFSIDSLPYAHYILQLPPTTSSQPPGELADTLISAYSVLLDLVVSTAALQSVERQKLAPGPPSYNVILTLEHLQLIPRAQETHTLETGEKISINSLGFAGMLLVNSEEEMQAVRSAGICNILKDVGMCPVYIPPRVPTPVDEADDPNSALRLRLRYEHNWA